MARITCRTPSTGKPIEIIAANVAQTYITISEAPDFSVPDTTQTFPNRDPLDFTRAIRPGEIFFLTPLSVKNKSANTAWFEIRLHTESNVDVSLGKVLVPSGDTAFIPIQGKSILKRNALSPNGDQLQVRAQTANTFDIWAAAEEKLSSEHIGVV